MFGRKKAIIKCDGRFPELRDHLYSEVMPIVLGDRTVVSSQDLKSLWDLVSPDIHIFDAKDPYFGSKSDTIRRQPIEEPLSLVPLIEHPAFHLADESPHILREYASIMGNSDKVADNLVKLATHKGHFFRDTLGRDPKNIVFPSRENLGRYIVSADVGIGTIVPGGMSGGGVRSDAPFLIEVYEQPRRGEQELASVIGFWAQDNTMLISQMQPCKNGHFPKEVPFGVGSLHVAETVASFMGFDKVLVYSAREHPIFKEHPEDWRQFGKDFVCFYDNSSKKLGYNGGRTTHHEKTLHT